MQQDELLAEPGDVLVVARRATRNVSAAPASARSGRAGGPRARHRRPRQTAATTRTPPISSMRHRRSGSELQICSSLIHIAGSPIACCRWQGSHSCHCRHTSPGAPHVPAVPSSRAAVPRSWRPPCWRRPRVRRPRPPPSAPEALGGPGPRHDHAHRARLRPRPRHVPVRRRRRRAAGPGGEPDHRLLLPGHRLGHRRRPGVGADPARHHRRPRGAGPLVAWPCGT